MARVSARRRRLKEQVVRDAGGRCAGCGYDRNLAGRHFHHVDPRQKRLAVAAHGARSLDSLRHEVKKCVLLCANCHAEVESGVRAITPPA
jgi:hypothetical protein